MAVKKQIVLIPFWIPEILKRNNLPLSACLNLAKLKPIMSLNDIVGFASLQDSAGTITGMKGIAFDSLSFVWNNSISKDQTELNSFLWDTISKLTFDPTFIKETQSRLFDKDAL